MALFGLKKKKDKDKEEKEKVDLPVKEVEAKKKITQSTKDVSKKSTSTTKQPASGAGRYAFYLKNPRITEKATMLSEQSVYTFDVPQRANKFNVKRAIEEVYNVNPVKVRMITVPRKNVVRRGKKGVKAGGKKALVQLKPGDIITFA